MGYNYGMEAAQSTSPPQQSTPPDPAAFLVALEARQVGQPPDQPRNERGAAQARAARLRQIAFERQVAAEEGDDVPPLPVGGRPPKIRYNHEAMANLILMNPGIKQKEIAIAMGYTEAWISTVMCSDAFQAYLAKRQAEVIDPEITLTLRERATGVATRSMQVLMEKLAKPADAISDGLVLRAFELSAKATGMGGNAPPPPAVDASANLTMLADRLCRLQGRTQSADVVDVQVQVREGGA